MKYNIVTSVTSLFLFNIRVIYLYIIVNVMAYYNICITCIYLYSINRPLL